MIKGFEIVVDNVDDNESVNYPIVLIKGCIRENNHNFKGGISVKCSSNNVTTEWPVHKGDFKCLAFLTEGITEVILQYEKIIKVININLKIHETDLCIVPVYLIPEGHDGKFQAPEGTDNSVESAVAKISFGVRLIQCMFGEKLKERGFTRKSFQIENDIDPKAPGCRTFHSSLNVDTVKDMSENELWESVGRELMLSELGNDKNKYLCFISSTYWNGEVAVGDPALGGGGLALLGSASLHAWPSQLSQVVSCFTDDRKLDPTLLDNSCYRGTYGGVLSTSLGSAAHELGHAFNLGHTRSGLMSRGFDHTGLVFVASPSTVEMKESRVELVPCLEVVSGPPLRPPRVGPCRPPSPHQAPSDLTHLEIGCAAILAHHPWFNPTPSQTHPSIQYDQLRKVVRSEAGLRVVQVRDPRGAVLRSWELRGSGRHMVLPSGPDRCSGATLLAVDAIGSILTAPL